MSQTSPQVRVRFAPSPTGYLHVGGARTALYNWLFARKQDGVFVLRIEDTDVQRSSQEMVDVILNSLRWLGLNWDEGPFFQSQRLQVYRDAALQLVTAGKAYRCFCKPEQLTQRREAGLKISGAWKYERLCYGLSPDEIKNKLDAGEPYAVRFLVPPGRTVFQDLVHREIALDHEPVDDFVLLRSDGFPTYHLSVVVDDIEMNITHVIRGDDHISNTPKQLMLYNAFGKTPPQFGHLPLILGPDKKRLSKRHGSVAVEEYRNQGILPEALLNFLALLGWNPGDEREIFFPDELIQEFDLNRVGSSNAVFDVKKLQWMNAKYLSLVSLDRVIELLIPYLPDLSWREDPAFRSIVELMRTRATSLVEIAEMLAPFFRTDFHYETKALEKFKKDAATIQPLLLSYTAALESVEPWAKTVLEPHLRQFTEHRGIKPATLIHPVRLALTGRTAGPGLFEIIETMGKDKSVERLRRFHTSL
jgi:glutamyl-tRNA synthetase